MADLDFNDNRTLIRAVFAGIALNGLVQRGPSNRGWQDAVESAVEISDLLLEELERGSPKEEGVAALKPTRRRYK